MYKCALVKSAVLDLTHAPLIPRNPIPDLTNRFRSQVCVQVRRCVGLSGREVQLDGRRSLKYFLVGFFEMIVFLEFSNFLEQSQSVF